MPKWSSDLAKKITGGMSYISWESTGLSIDTRTLKAGDLFFAIRGQNFDGHDFVLQALRGGAAVAVVDRIPDGVDVESMPILLVKDVLQAMHKMACYWRDLFRGKVIAITGSCGKTTVKNILELALSVFGKVHCSVRSFNNHLGVPISILQCDLDVDYMVLELGSNHSGEIALLAKIARPDIALITNVYDAHIGNFSSLDAIADEKSDMISYVRNGGFVILNRDNDMYPNLLEFSKNKNNNITGFTFGENKDSDLRLINYSHDGNAYNIKVSAGAHIVDYSLNVFGSHFIYNSLASLMVPFILGLDVQQAANKLVKFKPAWGRGHLLRVSFNGRNIKIIDDAYNASPYAMRVALRNLSNLNFPCRKIAILGDMFELGEEANEIHSSLVNDLEGIDLVITVGTYMKHLHCAIPKRRRWFHCEKSSMVIDFLADKVQDGDLILVKGSRRMRLIEEVVEPLCAD